jgi:hypothetical protein
MRTGTNGGGHSLLHSGKEAEMQEGAQERYIPKDMPQYNTLPPAIPYFLKLPALPRATC